ncbi:MAG: hypothetical protein OXU20_15485 [Myxococcales bacterium]|nr:hypothetical protein [Myxococcales bacterium]MDD9968693.1 hypothetical protein [Myxococcales bacterium]
MIRNRNRRGPALAYGLPGALLLATVPWATGAPSPGMVGVPGWAALSLATTAVYALALVWALGDRFADEGDPAGPNDDRDAA